MTGYKRVRTDKVISTDWLSVERHGVARADGTLLSNDVYTFEMGDWVNVVAITADDQFVLVKQHRFGIESDSLEIPGGIIEPGEDPAHAAARELREETGYVPATITSLGWVSPNPAVQRNKLYSYVARGCVLEGPPRLDDMEDCRVVLASRADTRRMVDEREIHHALVLVALERTLR